MSRFHYLLFYYSTIYASQRILLQDLKINIALMSFKKANDMMHKNINKFKRKQVNTKSTAKLHR